MIVIVGLVVLHAAGTVGCNGADPIGRCNPPKWVPLFGRWSRARHPPGAAPSPAPDSAELSDPIRGP